eukprot:GEZU01022118.1.p1 GENE.GEZU01022118.1~~GEZU01022118.1.p1  ORF type:complete len:165 (+),score=34.13 GEZU01022118.1:25-519(+)
MSKTKSARNEPFLHKFSWLNEPADLNNDCIFCITYRNSPCETVFTAFQDSSIMKMDAQHQLMLLDSAWEKRQKNFAEAGSQGNNMQLVEEHKKLERAVQNQKQRIRTQLEKIEAVQNDLWLKVVACTQENFDTFQKREEEKQQFFEQLKNIQSSSSSSESDDNN